MENDATEPGAADNASVAREVAMAPDQNEELTRQQVGFLDRQGRVQARTLEIQAATLINLHAAHQSHRIHMLRERLHAVVDFAVSAGVVMIVGLIGWGIVGAGRAQGVVVSAFEVPPALALQGLSGAVVAGGVLDQLRALQSATRAPQTKRDIEDAWNGEIKLEIPQAHISISEVQHALHVWLGHETRIGGDVVQHGETLELTVRGSGFPARTFIGKVEALSTLTVEAAEYIYGHAEPVLYGTYLNNRGRSQEAIEHAQHEFARARPTDQPELLKIWGNALARQGQFAEALERYHAAIRRKPDYWVGYNNIIVSQKQSGDEAGAYRTGRTLERLGNRYGWRGSKVPALYFRAFDNMLWDLPTMRQGLLEDQAAHGSSGSGADEAAPLEAELFAQMHDDQQARLKLQTSPGANSDPWVLAQTRYINGLMAQNRGDTAPALVEYEALAAAIERTPSVATNMRAPQCWIALGEELGGHPEHADAALAKGGRRVDCYRFKGDIADHRGDWAQARKDYAAAVALAPDLPAAYQSWGETLARHGDYAGAIAKYRDANARGPHWCDPPARWGEALAAQGEDRGAIKQYARASELTTGWAHLELVWGQALERLGRHAEAEEKFSAARERETDLSDADRAALKACCGSSK